MVRVLLLIPTDVERRRLPGGFIDSLPASVQVELCGFGPIAAAARTAKLLCEAQPKRVLLLGIAGTYRDSIELGQAMQFERVVCDGVGVGEGSRFRSAAMLGWRQWPDEAEAFVPLEQTPGAGNGATLITACAAADTPAEARARVERWPDATAEDMEGYGVAGACRQAGVPCQIIRGISNRVGERDKAKWQIDAALAAAATAANIAFKAVLNGDRS